MLEALVLTASSAAAVAWSTDTRTDPITDQRYVTATAVAGSGFQGEAAITVRCHVNRERLELVLQTQRYLDRDPIAVTFRFDSDAPVSSRWTPSTKGSAAFSSPATARAFVQRATTASRLVVRVSDYQGTNYDYAFPLAGAAAAIRVPREACSPTDTTERERRAAAKHAQASAAANEARANTRQRWYRQALAFSDEDAERARAILTAWRAWNGPVDTESRERFGNAVADFALRARFEWCRGDPARAPEGIVCHTAPTYLDAFDVVSGMCPGQLGVRVCRAERSNRTLPP